MGQTPNPWELEYYNTTVRDVMAAASAVGSGFPVIHVGTFW